MFKFMKSKSNLAKTKNSLAYDNSKYEIYLI